MARNSRACTKTFILYSSGDTLRTDGNRDICKVQNQAPGRSVDVAFDIF